MTRAATSTIQGTIHTLEAERDDIEDIITRLKAFAEEDAANTPQVVVTQSSSFAGMGIAEAATRYLREAGAPKSTREIMEALKQRGLPVKRYQTVYGLLHRRKQQRHDVLNLQGTWRATDTYRDHHAQ